VAISSLKGDCFGFASQRQCAGVFQQPPYRDLTKFKKVFKYKKGEKLVLNLFQDFAVCAMRVKTHVSKLGRHRGYAEPSGVTGVAFYICAGS
jgi:hypothetical protein